MAITGDKHSVNKANFAILYCFGPRFEPRFTAMHKQLKELNCADDPALYEKYLICPVGQVDLPAIVDENQNMNQIVATLGLKEMTQGTLIRKLCTYTTTNPTRRAIFEFDKLIRSIYTLRYLRNPPQERNVHRSQNRIESYHQLRTAIAQAAYLFLPCTDGFQLQVLTYFEFRFLSRPRQTVTAARAAPQPVRPR